MIDPKTRFNIRKIRELKGYSQEFMAMKLKISTKSYSRIECDTTILSVSRLKEIAEVFGVSVTSIIEFDSKRFF